MTAGKSGKIKVLTILGTRPEIIRLSRIIGKLDALGEVCDHVVVHTGQNYDRNLNDVFFEELGVRAPDHYLGAKGSFGEQIGMILAGIERVMLKEKPDKFLVLGDTNSSLAAVIVKRMGTPVYHMEAGNRCFDDRAPEEVNRRIIDHSSDVLLPYTERSRQNLLAEGIPGERIYVTGNPINEVIQYYDRLIRRSTILKRLGLRKGKYFLVTIHRAENVDVKERLQSLTRALAILRKEYRMSVIVSTHPRTKDRMGRFGVVSGDGDLRFLPPFGFFDFITLERKAFCVLSDSGTVQEECCLFGIPTVTLRDVTERPETLEAGSNMLSGAEPESILSCVKTVLDRPCRWSPPPEYLVPNVSGAVAKILLGYMWR